MAVLEADLKLWSCPLHCSMEGSLLPFMDLCSANAGNDQPASALLYTPPSPFSTACFLGDEARSVTAEPLSPVLLSSDTFLVDDLLLGNEQCNPSREGGRGALQVPFPSVPSLPSIECTDDAFWNLPWDGAAMQLCDAANALCTAARYFRSCSDDMDSCQTILAGNKSAPAKHACLVQRAGSADTEASCASTAVQPTVSYLPYQPRLPEAPAMSLTEGAAKVDVAPATPSSAGPLPLRAATNPALMQALARPESAVAQVKPQCAAACLVPGQACARPASVPAAAGQLPSVVAHPMPRQELALPANTSGPAAELGAAARPPTGATSLVLVTGSGPAALTDQGPQPGRPRSLAKVLKFRQQQQAYSQRRKVCIRPACHTGAVAVAQQFRNPQTLALLVVG